MPKKRQQILITIVFLLCFGIFLKGLCPSVYLGDNGDFLGAVATLGICHPTGYPTFLLLNKLFSFLPAGEIAFRLTLFSATMAAFTSATIFLLVTTIFNHWPTALWSTLITMGCSTLLSQGVIFEVYTFNASLVVLTILSLVMSFKSDNNSYLLIAGFVWGIGLTNHLLTVLIFPALAYLYFTNRTRLTPIRLITLVSVLLLAYGLNLYLPLRSYKVPPHQWTEVAGFSQLLEHLNGAQYRHMMFNLTNSQYLENLRIFFNLYFREFSPYLLPFVLIGFYHLKNSDFNWLVFTALLIGCILLYNLNYHIPHEIKVYYLPASLMMAIVIGLGLAKTADYISSGYVRSLLCLFLALSPLLYNFPRENRRWHFYAFDVGANILRMLPEQAVFFVEDDSQLLSLSYQLNALGKRPDIRVINRVGTLFEDFYGFRRDKSLRELIVRQTKEAYFIRKTIGTKAIFTGVKIKLPRDFILQPRAYIYEVSKKPPPVRQDMWRYLQMRKR